MSAHAPTHRPIADSLTESSRIASLSPHPRNKGTREQGSEGRESCGSPSMKPDRLAREAEPVDNRPTAAAEVMDGIDLIDPDDALRAVARIWTCDVCRKSAPWGPTWSWYGSWRAAENCGHIVTSCSDTCRDSAKGKRLVAAYEADHGHDRANSRYGCRRKET